MKPISNVIVLSLVLLISAAIPSHANTEEQASSTIYLLRHTEKDLTTKTDPALTAQGIYRAKKWAEVLSAQKVSAVYSTDYQRTRDTAEPIATSQNLEVSLYDAKNPGIVEIANKHKGEIIVVVGHSNTIPHLVNALINKESYSDLDERDYDQLFIVQISNGFANAQQLKIVNTLPE